MCTPILISDRENIKNQSPECCATFGALSAITVHDLIYLFLILGGNKKLLHPAGELLFSAIADSNFFFCKDEIIHIGSVVPHSVHLLDRFLWATMPSYTDFLKKSRQKNLRLKIFIRQSKIQKNCLLRLKQKSKNMLQRKKN